ncbi:mucin-22-like isoform X1 [Haliotis rubra]|uniref:mucin-22-like isoform X1 n=1 Tax=Haliotis rubra TaxID=36100 RepID=UPI001EE5FC69|nr:mucin-22-like isoform X1 [Haliotis rubra]
MHVERAFVICLHFFLAVYGVKTGKRCVEDLPKIFTVQLQCPAGEWIHVSHVVYGDRDAVTCRVKSAESCSKKLDSSQSGLVVNCNGKHSCHETMHVQTINNCNITDAAAEVKYNCIKGSMNMRSPVTTTVNGSVYLHSPGFPDSVGVNSSCVVRITGQTLQVTLVEERLRSGMLNISGDGRQLWTNVNANQYNRILSGQAAEIVIVYNNHDHDGSNLWIKVADSGQMNITISGETLNISTTPTPTQQPSQSTSDPSTPDTQSTGIVAASFTTPTSTHGHTTNSTGSKATQSSSKSTTMVSTTVSITDTVTMRSRRTCAQTGDITVELQCSVNERIHVEKESYGYGATNPCRLQNNGSCREVLQTSIHGLAVNCNGEQTCNETVSPVACNIAAAAAAQVHYKCINDSMDICDFDTINAAANESVYLHSPGYPYSVWLNKSCVVRITGKGIQVTLVEQSLNGGNLTISSKSNKQWSNVNTELYNRKLTVQYSEVAISYTDGGNNRSNVWISVLGSTPVDVTFNGGMITPSATSTLFVPMTERSSPQHDVTSQRMSVTQSVMPTSTLSTETQTLSTASTSALSTDTQTLSTVSTSSLSTDTQTLSTVSTSAHLTTMITDTVPVTTTATVEVTSKTAGITMTIAPTATSVAENLTDGMASNETTHIPRTPNEDLVVVVASIAACCVVSVIVVVVVAVVLCRFKNDKAIRSATSPHNGGIDRPLELNSHHNRPPDGLRKHDGSQHYFIIDPAFVPGNVSLNTDSTGNEGTRALRVQDGYSTVLPRTSRLNMNEHNTFTIKHPISTPSPDSLTGSNEDEDVEDTESPGTGDLKADTDQLESMDSFLFDRKNSTKSTCHMTENDVYSGGPPTTENHDVSTDDGNQDEESTPEDDLYHEEEDVSGGTVEGMVDNDMYESSGYDTKVVEQIGECEDVSISATQDISTAGSAKEEVDMMSNDLYHSFV